MLKLYCFDLKQIKRGTWIPAQSEASRAAR